MVDVYLSQSRVAVVKASLNRFTHHYKKNGLKAVLCLASIGF